MPFLPLLSRVRLWFANLISSSVSIGSLNKHQLDEMLLTACNYYQLGSTSKHVQKCSTCQKNVARMQVKHLIYFSIFNFEQSSYETCLNIVTRNNIVWKLAPGYCLCFCKTFSLVPGSTDCTKIFFTEECSTIFVLPKIK